LLVAVALLHTASALLHSHAKAKQERLFDKYAYVTMKYVYGRTIGEKWEEKAPMVMNDEQVEADAKKLFNPERAAQVMQKARSFKTKMETEQQVLEGALPCSKRDPARQVNRLAKQLSDVNAKYPLIVYTNDECLANMTNLPSNIILETNFKYLPKKCAMNGKNNMHFHKLGVFEFTQYKKLMWMDWDLQVKENIDDLFDRDTNDGKTVYGQRDDWKCTGKENVTKLWDSASGGFCSGLMLFEPKAGTVDELIASQGKICWGDQVVISRAFSPHHFITKQETGRQWKVWDNNVISFRGCQRQFKPKVVHHADLPGNDPGPAWK